MAYLYSGHLISPPPQARNIKLTAANSEMCDRPGAHLLSLFIVTWIGAAAPPGHGSTCDERGPEPRTRVSVSGCAGESVPLRGNLELLLLLREACRASEAPRPVLSSSVQNRTWFKGFTWTR